MIPVTTGLSMAAAVSKILHTIPGGGTNGTNNDGAKFPLKTQTSLTDIAKLSRVEPVTIVDQDCQHLDYLTDVLQSVLSIFTGYYLQAVSILGSVDSVKVIRTLASVNPNNSSLEGYSDKSYGQSDGTWKQTMEAYRWALPTSKQSLAYEEAETRLNKSPSYSAKLTEASKLPVGKLATMTLAKDDGYSEKIREASNLAVGKLVNVTLCDSTGGTKVTLPISVRLAVNIMPSEAIKSIFTLTSRDTSALERFHYWKAGRIEFFRDLVLCQDMIDERKRILIKDKEGVYSQMVSNANAGNSRNFFGRLFNGDNPVGKIAKAFRGGPSGTPSLATASNIAVISDTTLRSIEDKLGGKITSGQVRNKLFRTTKEDLFDSGYLMLLVVIDKQYERVNIYHRGVDTYTSLSIRDIKVSNKGSGPDIMDILKALGMGQAPSL